jgi:hypothetical protein
LGLFPLPGLSPPYQTHSQSRRCIQRYKRLYNKYLLVSTCINSLNKLSYSFLDEKLINDQANINITSSQIRLCSQISQSCDRYYRRLLLSDDDKSELFSTIHSYDMSTSYSQSSTIIPLIADQVALPEIAGAVDMLDCLPNNISQYYSSSVNCIKPSPDPNPNSNSNPNNPKPKMKPKVFAEKSEYIKLLSLMKDRNMIDYVESKPHVINGLFGVPKSDGKIRLIIDARLTNDIFNDPPYIELPGPDLLSKLKIDQPETIYVAKTDLSDFYYRIRIPEWMKTYFGLPPIMMNGKKMYPVLKVLAMGWSHSVFVTQTIHQHLLNIETKLNDKDRINSNNDLLLNRTRHLVYIDDLIIIGHDRNEIDLFQKDYCIQMENKNFKVKQSKIIPPTSTGVDCLGMELNGNDFTIGIHPIKLNQLIYDTRQLLFNGYCTGRALSRIVGKWTWSMLVFRPALSIFNSVYRFIESSDRICFKLWTTVRYELECCIGIAPLLWSSLDNPWWDKVIATDASMIGQGVCATKQIPLQTVVNISSLNQNDNNNNNHNNQILHNILNDDDNIKWSTIISSKWNNNNNNNNSEHINSLELRSIMSSIKWCLSYPSSIKHRILLLSDSQVAVNILTKGRSSSHKLLRRTRSISAHLLASHIQLFIKWIPSHLNPADSPSRNII